MASPSTTLLIQIQSDIADINKVIQGLNNIKTTAADISTSSSASIGAFSAAFEQAFEAIETAAKKTGEVLGHFLEGFINEAAKIQEEEFPLTQILKDNGVVAKQVLEGLHSVWQDIGVISSESLSRAARSLLLMNVPADNLIARLIELGKVGKASGEDIDQVAGAYQRVRQAIEKETAPAVRGVGAFGLSTLAIFQALEDHFGKLAGTARISEGQLIALFQGGKVSIDDLNKALREAADQGGRFFNVFSENRNIFNGAVQAMKTAWEGLQLQVGTPIIDTLTPLIQRVTDLAQAFKKLALDVGWQDTLRIAWAVLMDEFFNLTFLALQKIAELFVNVLSGLFTAFGQIGVEFYNDLKLSGIKVAFADIGYIAGTAFSTALAEAFGQNLPADLQSRASTILYSVQGILNNLTKGAAAPDLLKLPPETPEETHRADTAKELSAALHGLELVMASIRQENALISSAPFMGMDEKQAATIQNIEKQMVNLQQTILKLNQLKDVLPLNDPQMAQLRVKIQTAENEFKKLGQELLGLTQPLNAELQKWANSFGSTAHQIAQTIEGTINASLQSLNQFLVTGKFNAQALLQQIVLLGLQLVEQLIIQRVVAAINHNAAVAEAAILGPAIATALAPAVTAQTIATDGGAAIAAPELVAGANAAILAILAPTAHEGGAISALMRRFHGGGLAADEVPIIAQEGEVMIQRSVAQQPGMMDYLLGLNAGQFHSGGFIAGRRYHFGGFQGFGDDFYGTKTFGGAGTFAASPHLFNPQTGGPSGAQGDPFGSDWGDVRSALWFSKMWGGFGTSPSGGLPAFGPTQLSTDWVNYPGVGLVPMAVPVTPDIPLVQSHWKPKSHAHSGGVISRFHSGGSVAGGGSSGGGGVHIYAFTDLKALTQHMASREGQKIIFDTVKGRRIDLGIS